MREEGPANASGTSSRLHCCFCRWPLLHRRDRFSVSLPGLAVGGRLEACELCALLGQVASLLHERQPCQAERELVREELLILVRALSEPYSPLSENAAEGQGEGQGGREGASAAEGGSEGAAEGSGRRTRRRR